MQQLELTQGTETETLEFGGPADVEIDERDNTVRVSVWGRHGCRRDVSLTAPAARRVAEAAVADADADDGEIVTETADGGAEVVVRERDGHRELTVSGYRRGRRVIRLTPFETEVAEGLRSAAAVVDDITGAAPEVRADGGRSLVDVTWEDETLLRLTHSGDTHVFVMGLYRHKGERVFGVELDSSKPFARRKNRKWVEEDVVEDYLQQSDDATTVAISEAPDTIQSWLGTYRDIRHPFDDFYVFVKHRDDGRYKDELAVETGKSPSDGRSGRHPEDVNGGKPAHYCVGTVREVFQNGGKKLPFTLDLKKRQTVGYQREDMDALLNNGLIHALTTAFEDGGVGPDAIVGDDDGDPFDDDPDSAKPVETDGGEPA